MNQIVVQNFHKKFGSVHAVRGVSLELKPGELYGLIGPDGAGKTTLIRAICTLLVPDEGSITVAGHDVRREMSAVRRILGYMPQRFSLYQDLTVEQNMRFFADLFEVPREEREKRFERLYRFSRLGPFKNRLAGNLSGGMKQKLALSCALIHTPQILVLDEPTYGVDPVSRQEFWAILKEIRREGTTILVSTAYMEEADLCDRIALMFNGKFQAEGTPDDLKKQYPYPLYRIVGKDLRALRSWFEQRPEVHGTQLFGDVLHVSFRQDPDVSSWKIWQQQAAGELQQWQRQQPSIEDVFLDLISGHEQNRSAS
jgi:ABC-2 type transport system ATP-binding protein